MQIIWDLLGVQGGLGNAFGKNKNKNKNKNKKKEKEEREREGGKKIDVREIKQFTITTIAMIRSGQDRSILSIETELISLQWGNF